MALFDKLQEKKKRQEKYIPATEHEAWIGFFYACIFADDDDSETEIETLSRMISAKQKFSKIDILPLYENAEKIYKKIGGEQLIRACAPQIVPGERDTLFCIAVEIVLADGILDDKEEETIQLIADELHVEKPLVDKIVEVILIRNKGNIIALN